MPNTNENNIRNLSWQEVYAQAEATARNIIKAPWLVADERVLIGAVPRGGIPAAQAILQALERLGKNHHKRFYIAEDIREADFFIDDLIDSGATAARYREQFPKTPFYALYDKRKMADPKPWIKFPWETSADGQAETVHDNITRLLQYIGEDPTREGLKDTPARVIRAWDEMTAGYKQKVEDFSTCFEDIQVDEMVVLRGIEFSSTCEHHLLPFAGIAHIGYLPDKKVIGISKLARILDMFAKRLQIQERIAHQVATGLETLLQPLGAGCVIEASHLCMVCRGVKKQNSRMITSKLTGVLKDKPEARQEFLNFIKG